MEYRHPTLCLLPIIISVQSVGVILILIAWYIRRKKRTTDSHLWPDEKLSTSNNTNSNISNAFEGAAKMTSLDPEDTVTLNLAQNGYIQGVKILEPQAAGNASSDVTLAHYFGGVRYALPPSQRWGVAQPLPSDYSYGTKEQPGKCDGRTVICPQPYAGDEGSSEDCFQCNIWTPVGERPTGGWPVVFYIHGGFLQQGSPNDTDPSRLLSETNLKCVFVAPAYRLAVLGFLSSRELIQEAAARGEPCGNQGFWDQRAALEWTQKYAHYFGGDESNITVVGYSAGSYSVFHQLAHDLYLSREKSIIRQAVMFSNGPGVQPKSELEVQKQFDALLTALNIPLNIPSSEKLEQLRRVASGKLVEASVETQYHQYRPWHDSQFMPTTLFPDIDNGSFARRMIERNVRIINGECRDEHFVYRTWYTPEDSLQALRQRLEADYPQRACDALVKLYYPDGQMPEDCTDWQDAFGRIYADMQVHILERGFVNALAQHGAGHLVYRYRIEYRVKCVTLPPEWGIAHSSDLAMWLWGNGAQLEEDEKRIVRAALIEPLTDFVNGSDTVRWGTSRGSIQEVRRLRPDAQVDVWHDDGDLWYKGLEVWNALRKARQTPEDTSKL